MCNLTSLILRIEIAVTDLDRSPKMSYPNLSADSTLRARSTLPWSRFVIALYTTETDQTFNQRFSTLLAHDINDYNCREHNGHNANQ